MRKMRSVRKPSLTLTLIPSWKTFSACRDTKLSTRAEKVKMILKAEPRDKIPKGKKRPNFGAPLTLIQLY